MTKLLIYIIIIFSAYNMNAQELFALSPINYPKTKSELQKDGSTLFNRFDITISKKKEILYKDSLIYKCDFTEYYEYLIEVFSNKEDYLIVSPLPKTNYKGVATPHNIDRGLILLFDYHNNKRFYANLDRVKRIEIPESFEFAKKKSRAFMIKNVDVDKKELVLLQGGAEIREVVIELYEF